MKRRDLLCASAAVPAVAAAEAVSDVEARNRHKNRKDRRKKRKDRHKGGGGKRNVTGMNVLLFITDQERAIMHFPKG
jgi:hypothetical protein